MWNKNLLREIEELKTKNMNLRQRADNAELELRIEQNKKMHTNVYVYLKNKRKVTVYQADDYIFEGDEFALIYKGESIVASIRKTEIIAISLNQFSVDGEQNHPITEYRLPISPSPYQMWR